MRSNRPIITIVNRWHRRSPWQRMTLIAAAAAAAAAAASVLHGKCLWAVIKRHLPRTRSPAVLADAVSSSARYIDVAVLWWSMQATTQVPWKIVGQTREEINLR